MNEPAAIGVASSPLGMASSDHARFELRVRLDAKDYLALLKQVRLTPVERFYYSSLPALAVGMAGGLLGLIAYISIDILWPSASAQGAGLAAFVMCAAPAYPLLRFVLAPAAVRGVFSGQPVGMGETIIVADGQGLTQTVIDIGTVVKWASIVAIGDSKNHLVLMISRTSGIIVPKRAFENADQSERFVEFVRSKVSPVV